MPDLLNPFCEPKTRQLFLASVFFFHLLSVCMPLESVAIVVLACCNWQAFRTLSCTDMCACVCGCMCGCRSNPSEWMPSPNCVTTNIVSQFSLYFSFCSAFFTPAHDVDELLLSKCQATRQTLNYTPTPQMNCCSLLTHARAFSYSSIIVGAGASWGVLSTH